MKNNFKIGIVIVNYNGAKYQNDALRSLYHSSYTNFDVIIVDSNSTDDSIELAKQEYPNVHYILMDENVGVAKGNNIGIKYAINNLKVDYVLLLNNDVVLNKDVLKNLLLNASEKVITVPKIYYYSDKDILWFAGGKMKYWKAGVSHIGNHKKDSNVYNKKKIINYAPTCCMLIHKKVFDDIGYIDENTFMYYDDTDFCQRLIDKNYSLLYVPTAYMWHKVNSSTGSFYSKIALYYNSRNRFYFMNKYNYKFNLLEKISNLLYTLLFFAYVLLFKKNGRIVLRSYTDYKNNVLGRVDNL